MEMEEKFDAIVIGAGAGGLGAGYKLATEGFNVVVLERGQRIGAKSVYGGRIYSKIFEKEIPEFKETAPVERWVGSERLTFMDEDSAVTLETSFKSKDSFVAILSKFNEWLGRKVEDAGGLVIPGFKVDDLVIEDGRVRGIVSGDEKLFADVVIDAEGVNPILAMKAGLRGDWSDHEVAVGVKEVIKLPKETIEERFNLDPDEGTANLFLGSPTKYGFGGGFLYTAKDTVSIGVVLRVDSAIARRVQVYDVVEDFRNHPFIRRLLRDGEPIEYSAHLVPEAGIAGIPKLYGDGILLVGDTAGFVLNRGITVRGVDFAFLSGLIAGEVVKKAHEEGDFSAETLSIYERKIRESTILKELSNFRRAPHLLSNPRFFEDYPKILCEVMKSVYAVGETSSKIYPIVREKMSGRVSVLTLLRDMLSVVRNL
jgi:electron transfer flavoprotein-quinone oxidoreductase